MRTKKRVVVVTGASSGIGRATALAFADRHCAVVLAARRVDALEQVAEECVDRGGRAISVPTDVSDAGAVENLARRAVEEYGRIDVWVNNAAVTIFGPFEEVPLEDIRRVLDVDVMGYVYGARAVLPIMRKQGSGILVDVSSLVGVVAQPYTHAYGMAKFAVRALSTSLRQELQLDGVRGVKVCTVLPATIDTPIFEQAANYTGHEVVAMPPVHTPERVARTIVNLVRVPRHEAVVGTIGRVLRVESALFPRLTERVMAVQVNRAHVARDRTAPRKEGNLYRPAPGLGSVSGGWHGRRRTVVRRAGVAALVLAGAAAARRRPSP